LDVRRGFGDGDHAEEGDQRDEEHRATAEEEVRQHDGDDVECEEIQPIDRRRGEDAERDDQAEGGDQRRRAEPNGAQTSGENGDRAAGERGEDDRDVILEKGVIGIPEDEDWREMSSAPKPKSTMMMLMRSAKA
jgi:hypothetical protein